MYNRPHQDKVLEGYKQLRVPCCCFGVLFGLQESSFLELILK